MPKKEKQEPQLEKRKSEVAVETLSGDSDDDETRDQDDGEGKGLGVRWSRKGIKVDPVLGILQYCFYYCAFPSSCSASLPPFSCFNIYSFFFFLFSFIIFIPSSLFFPLPFSSLHYHINSAFHLPSSFSSCS